MALKFLTIFVILCGISYNIHQASSQRTPPPPRPSQTSTSTSSCDKGHSSKVSPRDCCDITFIFENKTASTCMKNQVSNVNVGIKGPFDGMECFFSCLFNSTGSFTNGKIEVPTLKSVATKTLSSTKQTKWTATVNEAIDFCAQKTAEFADNLAKSLKGQNVDNQNVCSPIPQFMGTCIYFRQIAKCPFRAQQSQQCNELVSYYQKCPIAPLF